MEDSCEEVKMSYWHVKILKYEKETKTSLFKLCIPSFKCSESKPARYKNKKKKENIGGK